MDNRNNCDLAVIGGGPAGMMCAITAAERGLRVTLLEPNQKLGRKLRITGKGRCNITNNCGVREFMANIPGDGRFLYSAVNRFGMKEVMARINELEKTSLEQPRYIEYREYAPRAALAALALLVLGLAAECTWKLRLP